MRMLLPLLALLLLAPAVEAGAKERPLCRPKEARTVDGSGAVRVYAIRNRVVACAYASGRTIRLGRDRAPDEVESVYRTVVRGRWVAWQLKTLAASSQGPFIADRLRLADVRGGREAPIGELGCSVPGSRAALVGAFDLTAQGRLAWDCVATHGIETIAEVRKYDADGVGVLDRVAGEIARTDFIDYGSVAIVPEGGRSHRGRVYWSRASGPRSADLR